VYKGKGILYIDEVIKLKPGKKQKKWQDSKALQLCLWLLTPWDPSLFTFVVLQIWSGCVVLSRSQLYYPYLSCRQHDVCGACNEVVGPWVGTSYQFLFVEISWNIDLQVGLNFSSAIFPFEFESFDWLLQTECELTWELKLGPWNRCVLHSTVVIKIILQDYRNTECRAGLQKPDEHNKVL
jgi:hypothetical protein